MGLMRSFCAAEDPTNMSGAALHMQNLDVSDHEYELSPEV